MLYKEPTGEEKTIPSRYRWLPTPYDAFMEEQNIPIFYGIGTRDIRELPMKPWKRMGGKGTFIELDGQAGMWGIYVIEVPAGGVLNPEHHIYEEEFIVFEGRGSTEIWREGSSKKQTFEWQPGTNFAIPLNTSHRLVNATSSPALLLGVTTASRIMSYYPSRSFIFDNPFQFKDLYDESTDYFKPREETLADPQTQRALWRTNIIPDIFNCRLPLGNLRAPAHRIALTDMAGNTFLGGFIQEYPSGRYSRAHYHAAGAVLICVKGKGYSYNWPKTLSTRPWEAGKGDQVRRLDYVPGGMVAAAPGGGEWFHQHMSIGKEPLRLRVYGQRSGTWWSRPVGSRPGQEVNSGSNVPMDEGGIELAYRDEDPQVRKDYQAALKKEGVEFQMPESLYR